ncbi:LLM class flavin-dependent oxidoreductase [Microbacterium sp. EYE_5]|uniref:LLM class flavin-dependent oxidoreductase n=1 Tax=unclassified Microbacterium TaxID=2609290 RepID=UPI0020061A64|nr:MULTISPECIES: LLM class flavin-dependent oxidoreductase [unclassified Microbacterium]MCK6079949.1 LLM class flavin-dependent oxidoreductase [Microbacterium sp. EYE_382]MCK6085220.1 LLM class flavin-dependent oxidoreductase [Microbacterium sp. EYE_384]MCK6122554.1 LLM class flavin-dependent oxidoreductase [Microbacterium sp. EYE_80]MCK6125983.1 LLM class flavin-dependent oxidoreductase [Microbacterium sp. EYE_79]MCK6140904.1 LLM class flavin-dependent oxidoreductase [Microbacterium sp. EYE_3
MSTATPALSVLDLVPVRTGQTSSQAIAASLAVAQRADELGYRRYWFAEHHNMPAVASTTPPVLIAATAARTSRIRVGSGGVMLPNHSPLVVAEQFAALEALAPGRVDLGIGRAPGSDPVITQLLRQSGTTSDVERFPNHITDIRSLVSRDGATVRFTSGGTYDVHATPAPTTTPEVWLLGSSDYSAQLAAGMGLPYVFANHFSGEGLERALDLYRGQFTPSETLAEPRTFLTANAVVAETDEQARAAALPQARMMARLRSNRPLVALETVEQAAAAEAADGLAGPILDAMLSRWFVGTGDETRSRIAEFAARHGVDEVMVSPVAAASDDEQMDAATARIRTLELLVA